MAKSLNVLLTGASAGIGLATARALTDAGHHVWGTARDISRLPTLPRLHPLQMDLNQLAELRLSFDRAVDDAGHIDVLINNAGEVINAPLEVLIGEGLRMQLDTLFFGPVELIGLALPHMRRRASGLIINITSLAVQFPIPFNGGYNAAKAALAAASEGLRLELLGTGVRVVEIQPGDVATEILRRTHNVDVPLCGSYEPNLTRARAAEAKKEGAAIAAERVAQTILHLLNQRRPPPRVVVGNRFESYVAPIGARLLPRRAIEWSQRLLYGLRGA